MAGPPFGEGFLVLGYIRKLLKHLIFLNNR
jgi:hypothetical protein